MAMDYNQLAVNILEAIGGSQNVENVSHCMTRLRFVMNDNAKVDMKKLQEINGVIRVIDTDTQLQIVIGSAVDKVYKEVCAVGNFESQEPVQQNADADKENKTKKKITPKSVANGIIDAVSGSLVPILPAIIAAGIFKMVAVLLGSTNLGVFTEDNQLYIFCNLVNTAGIPFSLDVFHKIFKLETTLPKMEWYLKPATPENQLKSSLKTYILMHSEELLKKDYSLIVGHMGFVDHNLMKLSSYNLYRISDLEAVTSPEIVKWVEDNQIELISYRNL